MLALALTGATLIYLLLPGAPIEIEPGTGRDRPPDTVKVEGPGRIFIDANSPLGQKLEVVQVAAVPVTAPTLTVTGTVVASRRPGKNGQPDFWQFNTSELLTTYSDWEKANADITFSENQLVRVKELAEARDKAQNRVVERLIELVAAGTDSRKDLETERANLIQVQITAKKDIYEAETAVRVARRNEGALARQLQQAGVEPELLRTATAEMDIVVADVPEGRLTRVSIGQGCRARFYGLPDTPFTGKVTNLAPVLSKERRTLRVLFTINDPNDLLRPGMFAEIGLGTDPREVLLVPAGGVLHIERSDYLLVEDRSEVWQAREVKVGERHDERVEILSGIKAGERVLGKGTVLLKPFLIESLRR